MKEQPEIKVHGTVADITDLENHRIWIGYDKQLFEDVQKEAFRLGYGWFGPLDDKDEVMYVHKNLSDRNAESISWLVFLEMQTPNGKFKVMAINFKEFAHDFESDTRGLELTIEDMRAIQIKSENK